MTNQEHPITPPPGLVDQWYCNSASASGLTVATQAARWGADQELEACCEWLPSDLEIDGQTLREHRRPKPPSLKELALGLLDEGPVSDLLDHEVAIIRRALEALPE